MTYKIIKLINNNVVFSENINHDEIIVFGKAIGFAKKPGDIIDPTQIVKVFALQTKQERNFLTNLVENIDPLFIDIASEIIKEFEMVLGTKVNDMLYLSLSDHISNAVSNAKEDFYLSLDILPQLKNTYPREYLIALKALDIIEKKTDIRLPEDEAGFVLIHYIGSQGKTFETNGKEKARFQVSVIKAIEEAYRFRINKDTFYYSRFLTHLSFFSARIKSNEQFSLGNDFVYSEIKDRYPEINNAVLVIEDIVYEFYKTTLTDEEKGYLALHILNLIKSTRKLEEQ